MYIKKLVKELFDNKKLWSGFFLSKIGNLFIGQTDKYITFFDTSICTENLGDYIILEACEEILEELFYNKEIHHIPTHILPTTEEIRNSVHGKVKIVGGTNILFSNMERGGLWKIPSIWLGYKDICLMGCGWGYYSTEVTRYTKYLYRTILGKNVLHSVRDNYTKDRLSDIGINNVLYTGCVTMWNLTEDFCKQIPKNKAYAVVTTLTDYSRDYTKDREMLKMLVGQYEIVYLWFQGEKDEEYFHELDFYDKKIVEIKHDLDDYKNLLTQTSLSLDYVGTRLHAGIKALNCKKRTIIIGVDNRAIEISKCTGLPVFLRKDGLNNVRAMIASEFETHIKMPFENINQWKGQFLQNEEKDSYS